MKKTMILSITAIITAAMLIGCGTSAPAGSSADAGKKADAPKSKIVPAVVDPIEVDEAKLPEGITKDDLSEKDGKFFLDQTDFKWLANAFGKNIKVASKDGFEYTATSDAKMVTKTAVTEKAKEQSKKTGNTTATNTQNNDGTTSQNAGTGNTGITNGGSTGGGASTPSNTASSSGGNSGGNTYVAPTQPAQPVHQHTWVAHTTTVDQGWYEDIVEYHQVCKGCGAILDGYSNEQLMDHMDACGTGYMGTNVVVGQQWVSNPVTVTDYYYCSGCGAIK